MDNKTSSQAGLLTLTADIVSSHVTNNTVTVADLPGLIENIYSTLSRLGTEAKPAETKPEPAVSIRASVKPDYIVCLEDGKKLKMLKRHLMAHYNMTPEEYRAKWNLPADYPMVAPNYAQQRRNLALSIGLGRKPESQVAAPAPAEQPVEEAAAQEAVPTAATAAPRASKARSRKATATSAEPKPEAPVTVEQPAAKPRGRKAADKAQAAAEPQAEAKAEGSAKPGKRRKLGIVIPA